MVTDSLRSKQASTHLRVVDTPPPKAARPFELFTDTPPVLLAGLTLATAGASLLSVLGLFPKG
ncbi:MAG: hypothetical protein VX223_18525 [Myxococcota bacterium]|nr:hypothetical protein [Myxococcota bacterium]